MSNSHWYRREPFIPPLDKRFRMRVGVNQFLVVTTNVLGVEVNYYSKPALDKPDWTLWLEYNDNPHLQGLRHPQLGWDLVGLARLFWAYVVNPNQAPLNSSQRVEIDETVSAQYQVISGPQMHLKIEETESLLRSVLKRSGRPMTRLELAHAIGKTKAPRLISIIESMVDRGEIHRVVTTLKNGKVTYHYTTSK